MSTMDDTAATESNTDYTRGTYFEDHSDPHVDGMVVIETGHISGYKGVRVAEKDTEAGRWRCYWMKHQYLVDEVNIGAVKQTKTLDESRVQSVENWVRTDFEGTLSSPERVTPAGD